MFLFLQSKKKRLVYDNYYLMFTLAVCPKGTTEFSFKIFKSFALQASMYMPHLITKFQAKEQKEYFVLKAQQSNNKPSML